MAIKASQVTVGTSATALPATALLDDAWQGYTVTVVNQGTASVFLGPATVTTANGYELKTTAAPLTIEVRGNEPLYGIVATATQRVDVLARGVV